MARLITPIALAGALIFAASAAQANGTDELALGQELLTANCGGCHAVGPAGDSPMPEAPPFRDLHERYDVEFLSEALVEGIITGHPAMPEFAFAPVEAAAIIAYLKSLE